MSSTGANWVRLTATQMPRRRKTTAVKEPGDQSNISGARPGEVTGRVMRLSQDQLPKKRLERHWLHVGPLPVGRGLRERVKRFRHPRWLGTTGCPRRTGSTRRPSLWTLSGHFNSCRRRQGRIRNNWKHFLSLQEWQQVRMRKQNKKVSNLR